MGFRLKWAFRYVETTAVHPRSQKRDLGHPDLISLGFLLFALSSRSGDSLDSSVTVFAQNDFFEGNEFFEEHRAPWPPSLF